MEWLDRDFIAGKSDVRLSDGLIGLHEGYEYRKRALKQAANAYINSANLKKDLDYYGIKISELF